MKRLSNKIMEIEPDVEDEHMYLIGYNDAKHAAAGMAIDYDDVMAFLVLALDAFVSNSSAQANMPDECDYAERALEDARKLDEHQKTEEVE